MASKIKKNSFENCNKTARPLPQTSVFLSYNSNDADQVLPLKSLLNRRKIAFYDYMRTPLEASDLLHKLRERVSLHCAIISILGRISFESPCFSEEFNAAGQYGIPQCIIQFAKYHEKPLILLTQHFEFIDATVDESKAVSGLDGWLDKMIFFGRIGAGSEK